MITITDASVVDQLVDIYYQHEDWHTQKMSTEEAYKYHEKLLDKGNIIVHEGSDGRVLGYVEFWRVNFEQWGRMVCHSPISGFAEDISSGNVCVVHNVWIHPDHRRGHVFNWLKLQFFKKNFTADYFVGEALRKKTQPIKVFKRSELMGRLFTEGKGGRNNGRK